MGDYEFTSVLGIDNTTAATVMAARRDVLKAASGAAAGLGLQKRVKAYETGDVDVEDERPPDDEHTVATFDALVDLIIPETPELAEELGEKHRAGGLNVDLTAVIIDFLDSSITIAIPPANDDTGAPLSEALATLMDAGAEKLLAKGENEKQPDPTRFSGGGSFASLARNDRRRALAELELQEDLQLVVTILVAVPMLLYYSDRTGYSDFDAPPGARGFKGAVQGWEQTGYRGPANGYTALRGYEVDEFEDNYFDDEESENEGESGEQRGDDISEGTDTTVPGDGPGSEEPPLRRFSSTGGDNS